MKNNRPILELNISELVIDTNGDGHPLYAGRSIKEIAANAKVRAPEMESYGGWNPNFPGVVFKGDDSKWHLAVGFSRTECCKQLKFRVGYFTETENDPRTLRLLPLTSNSGTPISFLEKGRLFHGMREGIRTAESIGLETQPTADELTKDADKKKERKHWLVPPQDDNEIAENAGLKSSEWVRQCIAGFLETPEIRELIEEGKVSSGVIHKAQAIEADGKRLDAIKAAIRVAKEGGKDCATTQHWDAVKADFVKPKPSKKADEPKTEGRPSDSEKTASKGNAPDAQENDVGEAPAKGKPASVTPPQSTMELGAPEPARPLDKTETQQAILGVLLAHDIEAKKAELITEALIAAGVEISKAY